MNNKNLLIWILVVGVFGILNTEMGVIGILPYVSSSYHVDLTTAGLLISLFALGVGIAGPTMPLLCSRFPRKATMLFVLGIFTICNALSIFTTNFDTLLALRVIPSIFHPVYCALAFSVAAELGGKNAPKEVAKINIGVSAGMVVGVPISNFLADLISQSLNDIFRNSHSSSFDCNDNFCSTNETTKAALIRLTSEYTQATYGLGLNFRSNFH